MKKALILSTFRSVKNSFGRFAAIFIIIAIGCGFYAGIKAAGPDMKKAAWKSYTEQNLDDIHLISTLGFEDDELEAILQYENAELAEAGYTADLYISCENISRKVAKVYSYNPNSSINIPKLTEGRFPENSSECVVDYKFYSSETPAIGDVITLEASGDYVIEDTLKSAEYTVVGYVQFPMYIAFERGTTSIGNGVINGGVLVPEENFSLEVYTDVYVSLKGADELDPFKEKYSDYVAACISDYEEIADVMVESRVQKITDEAYDEINDAKAELSDAESELSDAREQLADGEKEYHDGELIIDDLSSVVNELNEILSDYETETAQGTDEVYNKIDSLNKGDSFATDGILEQLIMAYMMTPTEYDDGTKSASKQGIEQYISALNENILEAEQSLDDARRELDDAAVEIADGEVEIANAKAEIADAENAVAEAVKDAQWYVFNRDDYYPYFSNYGEDCDRIDAIAKVFPIFFILVAALVCWTTMGRMVEEQRIQIGTLKALGYGRFDIISQYILYALAASIPGALVGLAIGFKLLPSVIFMCYQSMYAQESIETPFIWSYGIICTLVACLCTSLASLYSCRKELVSRPAQLMRAKPPKNGKRIILERFDFFWKGLKFTQKVTFRNLFRYKSRAFMTIIGVGGCTALLLAAFGLRYSIVSIVDRQYVDVFKYDALIAVDEDKVDFDKITECINETGIASESMYAMQKLCDIYNSEGETAEVYLVVPENEDQFRTFVDLHERVSQDELDVSEDGIIINEKLSRVLDLKTGDKVHFNNGYDITVMGIAENYTYNFVYMSASAYDKAGFDNSVKNNIVYVNITDISASAEDTLSEALVNREDVLAITYSSDGVDKFRSLVSSLSLIVVVIIVAAGALAFVVMFNLANINVNERIHELATIKVLGFYDGETAAYIYRENTASAMLGMIVGLVVGIFFEGFVIKTAEVDAVMFAPDIPAYCFLAAAGMTILFTAAVDVYLYFRLKKIDMAASLKAIE